MQASPWGGLPRRKNELDLVSWRAQVKHIRGADCKKWINMPEMLLFEGGEYQSITPDNIDTLVGHFLTGLWHWCAPL